MCLVRGETPPNTLKTENTIIRCNVSLLITGSIQKKLSAKPDPVSSGPPQKSSRIEQGLNSRVRGELTGTNRLSYSTTSRRNICTARSVKLSLIFGGNVR